MLKTRVIGIEPIISESNSDVLPLNYTPLKWTVLGSNQLHLGLQPNALPVELTVHKALGEIRTLGLGVAVQSLSHLTTSAYF